jgi:UDP-glucuronate 4-epimerase
MWAITFAPVPGRFLVTGANGAVGAWTLRRLIDRGHHAVALDVGDADHRLAMALEPGELAALVRVRADITDLEALERVLDEHEITNVIHLAALQVPFVRADPALGARVNVVGTVNVLEAVRRRTDRMGAADRMGPVVYASSIAVVGPRGEGAADDHPSTLYGVYKRANESTAARYAEDYGVPSIGLRPHTVYGPGRDQGLTSAPTVAMLAAAADVPYRIPFGGSAQMQYAPDVGEAFVRAAELDRAGASVHNVDGPVVSMRRVIEVIESAAPGAAGLISAEDAPLPFAAEADAASFAALLGGPVTRSIEAGVRDAIERFRALLADGRVQPPPAAA